MTLSRRSDPDALRPALADVLEAWTKRVRADREQVERCREVEDPADFYAPVANRFRADPRRSDDAVVEALRVLARPDDAWLDIGAGGGRYALPMALTVRTVHAVDPSPAMLAVLAADMAAHDISGIVSHEGRWPALAATVPAVDVSLMAHVGYDIEDIGAFLDAAERVTQRTCIVVMGEAAKTTAATLFWEAVHGEPRVPLPALPEMLTLLIARGRLPSVSLATRDAVAYDTLEGLLDMARRQLWVRPGSARDETLARLVRATATRGDAGWSLDWRSTRVGIVAWEPGSRPGGGEAVAAGLS